MVECRARRYNKNAAEKYLSKRRTKTVVEPPSKRQHADDGISIDDSSDEEDVEDNISPDDESQTSSDEDDGM